MKVVFLGATKGMGRALARLLAERGDSLFLLGRDAEELAKCAADLQARMPAPGTVTVSTCDLEDPDSFDSAIAAVCRVVLWLSTTVIFVILVANTVLRYATGSSLQWANEVPELLFPWLVMAGVVLAAQHGAHITTSFLVEKLPFSLRRVCGVGEIGRAHV